MYGHHGLHEAERTTGQLFIISAQVQVALPADCVKIEEVLDYEEIMSLFPILMAKRCVLLEELARRIAQGLLGRFKEIMEVEVRIMKQAERHKAGLGGRMGVSLRLGREE